MMSCFTKSLNVQSFKRFLLNNFKDILDFLKMCKPLDVMLIICIKHKSKYLENDVRTPN